MKAAGLCTYKWNDFSQYDYSKLHRNGPKICYTIISNAKTNIFFEIFSPLRRPIQGQHSAQKIFFENADF